MKGLNYVWPFVFQNPMTIKQKIAQSRTPVPGGLDFPLNWTVGLVVDFFSRLLLLQRWQNIRSLPTGAMGWQQHVQIYSWGWVSRKFFKIYGKQPYTPWGGVQVGRHSWVSDIHINDTIFTLTLPETLDDLLVDKMTCNCKIPHYVNPVLSSRTGTNFTPRFSTAVIGRLIACETSP